MADYTELVKSLRQVANNSRYTSPDLLKDAADAIEELQARVKENDDWWAMAKTLVDMVAPKWIPVMERLPEKNTWVLAYCKYKDHVVDYVDINGLWSYGNVTHWMPLPEPPKEENV